MRWLRIAAVVGVVALGLLGALQANRAVPDSAADEEPRPAPRKQGPLRPPLPPQIEPLPALKESSPTAAVPILAARALASPQTTVQTQLSLLQDGQRELFAQTFVEALRPQVTPEVFKACQVRVNQVPVKPDWEMAEDSLDGGKRILRVSIYGKSLTGFDELDGRWLADTLWCVPTGLP